MSNSRHFQAALERSGTSDVLYGKKDVYEIQDHEFFPRNPRIEATPVRKGEIASREAGLGAIALVPPHNVVSDKKTPILNLSIPAIKKSILTHLAHVDYDHVLSICPENVFPGIDGMVFHL